MDLEGIGPGFDSFGAQWKTVPEMRSDFNSDICPDFNPRTLHHFQTFESAINFAQKWLPPITEADKVTLMNVIGGTDVAPGTLLLRKYIELLRPYTQYLGLGGENKPREADCVASGIIFFYVCLLFIMHFPGWGRHIEDIMLYNILYLLVDHYIDDIGVESELKTQAIAQMAILIEDPMACQTMTLIDPTLKVIALVYHRLLNRCPAIGGSIKKLFKAEIKGLSVQKNENLQREQYYEIAAQKGGYTIQVLQDIVGNTDPQVTIAAYNIGIITQLIDDSVDVLIDARNGIHTIATHDLKHEGKLDQLWLDIMSRVAHIDSQFVAFIFVYTVFAVYIPDRMRANYSEQLRAGTNPINLFDYTHGCDGSGLLVEWITSELVALEALNALKAFPGGSDGSYKDNESKG